MAYNEQLADRVRRTLARRRGVTERKMFGGIAFMLRGNMCCGVLNDDLIVRVPHEETAEILEAPHTRAFDFTGRSMNGFVVVEPGGCRIDADFVAWLDRAVEYARKLPAKKKKPKKK